MTDQLGEGEVTAQVTFFVDGKNVGHLTVNEEYPNSRLLVPVPRRGHHFYTAEASAILDDEGTEVEYRDAGQGIIKVEPGKNYSLRESVTGNAWLVGLEEEQ